MSSQAPAESENSRPRKGMARVIRDEKGRVVDIVEYEEEAEEADTKTPWGDTLNQDEDEPANLTMLPPRLHEGKEGATVQGMSLYDLYKALEKLSSEDKPVPRFTSVAEHQWLVELICAHGTDVQAMARDRKRNVWQKTAGEIKRAYVYVWEKTNTPAFARRVSLICSVPIVFSFAADAVLFLHFAAVSDRVSYLTPGIVHGQHDKRYSPSSCRGYRAPARP